MKAVAYLASYKQQEQEFLEDLASQRTQVEEFCARNQTELGEVFVEENFGKEDFKPILLRIIHCVKGLTQNLVLFSPKVLSEDEEFVLWVEHELLKVNVKIEYVQEALRKVEPLKDPQAHFAKLVKKLRSIPSLPGVVRKMLLLIHDEHSSLSDLVNLITLDVGLSSKVLKLVNSAYYGFPKRIGTINHALSILGVTTMRGLVLSSSVFKMVGIKGGFDYRALWAHNFLTAMAAKLLAETLLLDNEEEDIFSCAIMHDLGKFVLAQYDFVNYNRVGQIIADNFDLQKHLEVEKLYCGTNHCEIGVMLAQEWGLPPEICDVILYHHTPELSENYYMTCTIVHIADILSNMVVRKEPINFDLFDARLLEKVSIKNSDLLNIYEKLNLEMERVDDYMEIFR